MFLDNPTKLSSDYGPRRHGWEWREVTIIKLMSSSRSRPVDQAKKIVPTKLKNPQWDLLYAWGKWDLLNFLVSRALYPAIRISGVYTIPPKLLWWHRPCLRRPVSFIEPNRIRRQSSWANCEFCLHRRRDLTRQLSCVLSAVCIGH